MMFSLDPSTVSPSRNTCTQYYQFSWVDKVSHSLVLHTPFGPPMHFLTLLFSLPGASTPLFIQLMQMCPSKTSLGVTSL